MPKIEHAEGSKSLDRKAAEGLVMQYRIERAARRVGWVSLIIFALFFVVWAGMDF